MKSIRLFFSILLLTIISNICLAQWSNLQQGVIGWLNTFYVDSASNLLFVGGNFDTAGGMNINDIATWDGTNWNTFGNNAVFSSPGNVSAIVNYNGNIIIGGDIDSIGLVKVNNIALWNGNDWQPIGSGFNGPVRDLIVYQGELYACGQFLYSDTNYVGCFVKWNGFKWEQVSQLVGYAHTFTLYNGQLIIGGAFSGQINPNFNNIVAWDGNVSDTSYSGFNNTVITLKSLEDTLYAVGQFTATSFNQSNYLSVFYNHSWHSIGAPTGGSNWITDVIKFNNELYVCGYFLNPPDICKYNGSGFDSVADVQGFISNLTLYNGALYAGGYFSQLNGININSIAKYSNSGSSIEDEKSIEMNILSVFPNPSPDAKFLLFVNSKLNNNIENIEVYNINGERIYFHKFNFNIIDEFSLELPHKQGVYAIKINLLDGRILTKKIIIL